MANEIQVRAGFSISNGNLRYQTQPGSITANQLTVNPEGPTPGSVLVPTAGVAISPTGLASQGGWCKITNRDATNYVTFGIKAGGVFYPLGELLPGEPAVLRLSRSLLYGASGTAHVQDLWAVADTASCIVNVEAFDP